jgi:hypothetical protein
MPQVLGTSKAIGGFDPLSIGGCQLWLDAADSTTITGTTTVTSWKDKSSRNYNLVPGTGTTSYAGNAVTITASYLYATGAVDLTTFTFFIVAKNNNTTNNQPIFAARPNTLVSYNSTDGFSFYMDTGTQTRFFGGSTTGQYITTAVTTSVVNLYSFTGTTTGFFNQWTNARQVGAATYTTRTSTAQGFSIGGEWSGTAYTAYASTANSIYEILVYNSVLPAYTQQAVENYLARKWSITIGSLLLTSPLDIPGCAMWFDAADPSTFTPANPTNGTTITQWNDKSSNANHLVKGSTGAPTYQVAGFNSMPALYFNATTTQWMQSATAVNFQTAFSPSNGDTTRFMVFSQTGGTCGGMWFQWTGQAGGNSDGVQAFGGANLCMSIYGTNIQLTNASNQPLLVSYVVRVGNSTTKDSTDLYCYASNVTGNPVSNLSTVPSALETWNFTEKAVIGAKDSNGNYGATGYHCEYIVYNQALSPAQSNSVLYYLAAKWGMNTSVSARTPGTIIPFLSTPLSRGFVPLDIPGCALWLDGADQSTMAFSSTSITQWNDKSGNGYNATVASGRTAATFSSSSNCVYFPASTTGYVTSYPANPTNETMFIVANIDSPANVNNNTIIGGQLGARSFGFGYSGTASSGTGYSSYQNNEVAWQSSSIVGPVAGVTGLITGTVSNTTNVAVALNGATLSTGTISAWTSGTTTYLGVDTTNSSYYFKGYVMEIIFYKSVLTTSQQQAVQGYLAAKWGLLNNLPGKTLSPLNIPGCALWLDAADSSTITIATGVSQWNDKSGNGYNFTQSTTTLQPTRTGNYLNFSNNYYLNIPAAFMNNYATWSLFFAINPISSSNWIMIKQHDGVNTMNGLGITLYTTAGGQPGTGTTGYLYWRSYNAGSQAVSSTVMATSTVQLYSLVFDGTSLYMYINGTLNSTTAGTFATLNDTSPTGYLLGGYLQSGVLQISNVTNFQLGEMLSYSSNLATTNRQSIENYLMSKWGISNVTHPFKSIPPSIASQFSPFAISGLALWLDASDASSITLTGSTVNQWNDKSGNARHFTQGTTASQPTYGTYLSYPGLYFNGANLMSNAYSHTGIFGRNTFIVFYDSNTAGNIYGDPPLIYMGGTGTGDSWRTCYIATSDALCIDMGSGAKIMTATSAVTTMRSLRCIAMWAAPTGATVSTTYVYGNGTQFTTQGVNSTGLTTAMNTNRSGGTSIGGGSGGNTTSVISEIIHYSFELSSNQRQAVEGYLAWKWGLQSKLPTTHPFYKFAPGYVRY